MTHHASLDGDPTGMAIQFGAGAQAGRSSAAESAARTGPARPAARQAAGAVRRAQRLGHEGLGARRSALADAARPEAKSIVIGHGEISTIEIAASTPRKKTHWVECLGTSGTLSRQNAPRAKAIQIKA
ncbi:MAG: hypothetical protein AAF264_06115 [Pseudomonadota bacterium]